MVLSAFVLIASLAGQASPAQAPAVPDTTDALSQAYFLFLQGHTLDAQDDTAGAIAAYRKAAALWPGGADIHAELAGVFARDEKNEEATKEANAAIAIDPENRAAHRILGFLQSGLADAAQDSQRAATFAADAIRHLELVMSDHLSDPNTELALGRLYVRVGRDKNAIDMLRGFLVEHPDYPDAMVALAQAYENSHQLDQAIDVLETLTTDQPDQPRIWTWLGDLDEQAGQWGKAAAVWGRLADANPRTMSYRSRQGTALINSGDGAGARRAMATVAEQSPRDPSAWYLLSQIDRRSGDATRAEEDARHIVAIDPADPRGPLAIAEAQASRRDFRSVVATLDPVVRSARPEDLANGSYARLVGALATALQETGESARAITLLEEARRRDSSNPALLFDLGAAYDRAKQFDRAEQTFREVISSDPGNADALNYLGYMLADRGKKLDEAVDLITRALTIEKDNPSYLDSLGWVYVKQSKLAEARDPLQRAAAARPKDSVIQDHLAALYFQLKLYRDAAAAWDRALSGDRAGVDAAAITKKRDRARALAK